MTKGDLSLEPPPHCAPEHRPATQVLSKNRKLQKRKDHSIARWPQHLIVCLPAMVPVYLRVCVTDLVLSVAVCLTICLTICLSVCLSVRLSICLTICLPLCLSMCLCLSICLTICLCPSVGTCTYYVECLQQVLSHGSVTLSEQGFHDRSS